MALDATAVASLFDQVQSIAQSLGGFETLVDHEPKAAPQSLPAFAYWWSDIGPARGLSGLDATSTRCEFRARIYLDALSKPEGKTEQKLLYLSALVLGAYSAAFTLGGDAVAVDLLGGWGNPLAAGPGWITHDGKPFRVAEITIPVLLDGTFAQEA
jgi:hypothetical protein